MPYDNNGGQPLAVVGDDVRIVLANNSLGHDGAATFSVSGTYTGAALAFEGAYTEAAVAAGTWVPLAGVYRLDRSTVLTLGEVTLDTNDEVTFSATVVTPFYAIRMRLTTIATGDVDAEGTSYVLTDTNAALLAAAATTNACLKAIALGLSDLTKTDLMAAVGSSFN